MFLKKIKLLFITLFFIISLFALTVFILNNVIQNASVQSYLVNQISRATGYYLEFEKIRINLFKGIGIKAENITATSKANQDKIVSTSIKIIFSNKELFKGRIIPVKIFLVRPDVDLTLMQNKKSTNEEALAQFLETVLPKLSGLKVVSLKNASLKIKEFPFELKDVNIRIVKKSTFAQNYKIKIQGNILKEQISRAFTIKGNIARKSKPEKGFSVDINLKTNKIPLAQFSWPKFMPVEKGSADLDLQLSGTLPGPLNANIHLQGQNTSFKIATKKSVKEYNLSAFELDGQGSYDQNFLKIDDVRLKGTDFTLYADATLDLNNPADPYLKLNVKSPFLPVFVFKKIFPTSLLRNWYKDRLFPIFQEGNIRLDRFSLNGTITQIRKLGLPENSDVLTLKLTLKDMVAFKNETEYGFENVTGKLIIEKGRLVVSDVTCRFGQSNLENADMLIPKLFGGKLDYHFNVQGLFELNDLKNRAGLSVIPKKIYDEMVKFKTTTGSLSANISFYFKYKRKNPIFKKGTLNFQDCNFVHENLFLPLKMDPCSIVFGDEKGPQFQGKGVWGNTVFDIDGFVDQTFKSIQCRIISKLDYGELIKVFYPAHSNNITVNQPVPCNFIFTGSKKKWSCAGDMDMGEINLKIGPVLMEESSIDKKISFNIEHQLNNALDFKNVTLSSGNSNLKISGTYDLKTRKDLNISLASDNFVIDDFNILIVPEKTPVQGTLKGEVTIQTSIHTPLKTAVSGSFHGKNVSTNLRKVPFEFKNSDFSFSFSGQTIHIDNMKILFQDQPIFIQGDLKGWRNFRGSLQVNVETLDLSDFKSSTSDNTKDNNSLFNRSKIDIELNTQTVKWNRISFGPFLAQFQLASNNIIMTDSILSLGTKGKIRSRGHIKRGKTEEILLSSYIKTNELPLKQIFIPKTGKMPIEGRLTLNGAFLAKGKNAKNLVPSMIGELDFILKEGVINKSHILLNILEFLSIQNILIKKPPDMEKRGFYYKQITGDIRIKNGIAQTDNFLMKSPVFNAAATGKIDLKTLTINSYLGTQPLGTIDFLVSNIPIIGHILTGKDKALLVYYFKIRGPITDPKIKYIPFKNLGKGALGIFERIFLTPERLVKKLMEFTKELKQNGNTDIYQIKENMH